MFKIKSLDKFFFWILILFLLPVMSCGSKPSPQDNMTDSINLPFEKFTLPNGLDVIFHTDKSLPMVHINIWYHVGSKNDPDTIHGFAHLFEHMMFQGSLHAPKEFLDYAGAMGADDVNASTNLDVTEYHMTIGSELLEKALWLESDRMGFMADYLDEKQFANQKDIVKNEKKERESDPYAEIQDAFAKYLFPVGHPYHWRTIGSMDELSRATLADVKDFYSQYYAPNNATLTLAGNFDPEQAKAWIEKYFGALKPGPEFKRQKVWVPQLDNTREIVFEKDVPLEVLLWVWPGSHRFGANEVPLDFASGILVGDENSRLYQILVHDKQLANEVFGSHSCDEIAGRFYIGVTLRPGADSQAVKTIVEAEIKNLAQNGPTAEELQRIKAQREYAFVSSLESLEGKASLLNEYNTFLKKPDFLKTEYHKYASTTAKQVQDAFQSSVAQAPALKVQFLPKAAQEVADTGLDRTQSPAPGAAAAFVAPTLETAKLANGLEIYVSHQPDLPKVLVSIASKTDNRRETAVKRGTAYLMGEALERGTEKLSFLDLKKKMASFGATIGSGGSLVSTSLTLSVLKKNLKAVFSDFADSALHPRFDAEEIERLKKERLDEIEYETSKPTHQADSFFYENLFGVSHPFGLPADGTRESIAAISKTDIVQEHQTFWRPNNAYLVFVGDITLNEAQELAQNYFSDWESAPIPDVSFADPTPPAHTRILVYDFPKTKQASIRYGFTGPHLSDADAVSLRLAGSILGGGSSGRLFKNLREDKGYTYGAYAGFQMTALAGYFQAYAEVQIDKVAESLQEIKTEIEKIKKDAPPTADELAQEKKNMVAAHIQDFGTNRGILNKTRYMVENHLDQDFFKSYVEALQKPDAAQLLTAVQKHFPNDGSTIVVVGDLKKMKDALQKIDWAEVAYFDRDGKPLPTLK